MAHMADIQSKDNPPTFKKTAEINYRYDSATRSHIYTSEAIPGMLVACKSTDLAKGQLRTVIRKLFYVNNGIDCVVDIYEPLKGSGDKPFDAVITQRNARTA